STSRSTRWTKPSGASGKRCKPTPAPRRTGRWPTIRSSRKSRRSRLPARTAARLGAILVALLLVWFAVGHLPILKAVVAAAKLVRISPALPYTPSNAVMGLAGISLRDMALGTFLGMAPGTLLYCWAGSLLPSAEAIEAGEGLHGGLVWVLLGAAFVAAAIIATA